MHSSQKTSLCEKIASYLRSQLTLYYAYFGVVDVQKSKRRPNRTHGLICVFEGNGDLGWGLGKWGDNPISW